MALTQITDPGVKDDAIKAKHIATDAVDSPEIAANAVGASELADNAVDTNAIEDNAVTADQIAENAVGNSELATNAVATGNVQDNAITAPKTDLTMAQGSLVVGTGADTWGTLAKGTAGQTLKMNSGATAAEWSDVGATDSTKMPLAGGTFTGDVIFEGSGTDRELKWDKSENILSLKYPTGTGGLEIGSNLKFKSNSATDSRIHLDNNAEAAILSYEASNHQFVPNTGTSDYKIAQFDAGKGAISGDARLYHYVAHASSSSEKLRTTNTGITVTGTTTTTGLTTGGVTYPTADGNANEVLTTNGSGTLSFTPSGSGKVKNHVYPTPITTETEITSETFTDTGLTASIQPVATTSKILVMIDQQYYFTRSARSGGFGIRVLRDATSIHNPVQGSDGPFEYWFDSSSISNVQAYGRATMTILDSPNTTSTVVYKTQAAVTNAADSSAVKFQRDSTTDGTSRITLLEIGV